MMDKDKFLQKEIDRLSRRNKLLTRRVKKLSEENQSLADELDKSEALAIRIPRNNICPKCASDLETMTLYNNKVLEICSNYSTCKYKKVKEK